MLKSSVILLSFACILSCGAWSASRCRDFSGAAFTLQITLTDRETSKDSHWTRQSVNIADRHACWTRMGGGFRSEEEKSVSLTLDETSLMKIKKFIGTNGLNRDIHEAKPTAGLGRSVFLEMEIFMDGKTTRMEVSGMSSDWSRRDSGRDSNIENMDIVNQARHLLGTIKTASK